MEFGSIRCIFEWGTPKDYHCKVSFNLDKLFDRNKLFNDILLKYAYFLIFLFCLNVPYIIKEFSVFCNGGQHGWSSDLSEIILNGDNPRTISAKFGSYWPKGFQSDQNQISHLLPFTDMWWREKGMKIKLSTNK